VAERKTKAEAKTEAAAEDTTNDKTARATSATAETDAAPLDAPEPRPRKLGHPDSSTNFVAANAALRSPPGSNHVRLLDASGADVDPESVFEFPPSESPSMMATVNRQVFQEFTYPEASTPTTQLLYPAGARVPVEQALKLRNALRLQAEEPAAEPHTSA
jgi:hypothetical protein